MKGNFNFNSFLALIGMAVTAWVGSELNSNGKMLAAMTVSIKVNTGAIAGLQTEVAALNGEMKHLVSRRDFELWRASIELRFREIDIEIQNLRIKTGGPR